MQDDIPRRRQRIYTEPVTIRLKPETKRIREKLKIETDWDISEVERQALEKAYEELGLKLRQTA